MSIPNLVRVVEIDPCDGPQNKESPVSTNIKVELVNRLFEVGFVDVEAAPSVSPKRMPAMADGADVMAHIQRRPGMLRPVLMLNMKGFESAAVVGADEIAIFNVAGETFAQKNINCTIIGLVGRSVPVIKAAKDAGIRVRGSTSYSLGCPYQGEVPASSVMDVIKRMADLGCNETDITDAIGVDIVGRVKTAMETAAATFPIGRLSGHFHDTYGQTLANILASLEVGITVFHASVTGLGGCSYAKGVTGNVTTRNVLYLLHDLGIHIGISLDKTVLAGDFISQTIGHPTVSRTGRALLPKLQDQITQACI